MTLESGKYCKMRICNFELFIKLSLRRRKAHGATEGRCDLAVGYDDSRNSGTELVVYQVGS